MTVELLTVLTSILTASPRAPKFVTFKVVCAHAGSASSRSRMVTKRFMVLRRADAIESQRVVRRLLVGKLELAGRTVRPGAHSGFVKIMIHRPFSQHISCHYRLFSHPVSSASKQITRALRPSLNVGETTTVKRRIAMGEFPHLSQDLLALVTRRSHSCCFKATCWLRINCI